MHKIKNRTAPSSFLEKFEQPAHSYPTRLSSGNYRKPQIILRKCRFQISIRGPAIWKNLVESTEKEIQSFSLFKSKRKWKLLFLENEVTFFFVFAFKKITHRSTNWWQQRIMTIVYSCLCFVSISWGLMTKLIGFLRVPPLKFVVKVVWFFSFLISLLFGPFFQYIFVYGFIYYSLIVIMGIFLARAL